MKRIVKSNPDESKHKTNQDKKIFENLDHKLQITKMRETNKGTLEKYSTTVRYYF